MRASWALTPPYFLVFAFLCGVVGFRIGWRLGRLALPFVQGALGWLAFLLAWAILGAAWAAASVGAWAVGTTEGPPPKPSDSPTKRETKRIAAAVVSAAPVRLMPFRVIACVKVRMGPGVSIIAG
jgi:hypothetical protein